MQIEIDYNRGNRMFIPHAMWMTFIERRANIERLIQSTVPSSSLIQDLFTAQAQEEIRNLNPIFKASHSPVLRFKKFHRIVSRKMNENVFNFDQSDFQLEIHSGRSLSNQRIKKIEYVVQSISSTTYNTYSYTIQPIISCNGHCRNIISDLTRNNIIKLQSLIHNQLSSPRYHNLIKYSWFKSDYINQRPEKFENPVEFSFDKNSTTCDNEDYSNITIVRFIVFI
ncbi:hypothetical protein ALC56_07530 [Trachymyrmex septentrionalis]|uniref:Uncharacterized protein n=1 Tax=Trachymyrmex septentrionalis TaxID=34720 RepID=A0A195FBX3_9HYME|nr:hypothetical protein ALC56_07530 [Trachymyrmex septentrionalis]